MDSRGTAILAKEGQTLYNIKRIPSGSRISTMFKGLWIMNISAPSGAEKMKEREELFNIDVTHLIEPNNTEMTLAGDLNCVLSKEDCTGQRNYSRALTRIIQGLVLLDLWDATPTRNVYALYAYWSIQNRQNLRQKHLYG